MSSSKLSASCLPSDVMELIADSASPVTLLNLQLADKNWASACKGKLRKYAKIPSNELMRIVWPEAKQHIVKEDWKRKFGEYCKLTRKVECFHGPIEAVFNVGDMDQKKSVGSAMRKLWEETRVEVEHAVLREILFALASFGPDERVSVEVLRNCTHDGRLYFFRHHSFGLHHEGRYESTTFKDYDSPETVWTKYWRDTMDSWKEFSSKKKEERCTFDLERAFENAEFGFDP